MNLVNYGFFKKKVVQQVVPVEFFSVQVYEDCEQSPSGCPGDAYFKD